MTDVQDLYARALDSLVAKLKDDRTVLAAVLMGSLAYDTVWQRSDIDLLIVTEETPKKKEGLCLVESGVNIHAIITTRSGFRKMLEGSVQGSFMHAALLKGRMLYSRDEALRELFESRDALGDRDRQIQLLQNASIVLACLAKSEKWFHVRQDYTYCAHWILQCATFLAKLEVLLDYEIPTREVIQQALPLNPELFRMVYTDLIEGAMSPVQLEQALTAITTYLHQHKDDVFGPILTYLEGEGALRSQTEINHHFTRHFGIESVDIPCEWLADEGFIQKLATPARITDRSPVSVEEAAYYYPGGGPQ